MIELLFTLGGILVLMKSHTYNTNKQWLYGVSSVLEIIVIGLLAIEFFVSGYITLSGEGNSASLTQAIALVVLIIIPYAILTSIESVYEWFCEPVTFSISRGAYMLSGLLFFDAFAI